MLIAQVGEKLPVLQNSYSLTRLYTCLPTRQLLFLHSELYICRSDNVQFGFHNIFTSVGHLYNLGAFEWNQRWPTYTGFTACAASPHSHTFLWSHCKAKSVSTTSLPYWAVCLYYCIQTHTNYSRLANVTLFTWPRDMHHLLLTSHLYTSVSFSLLLMMEHGVLDKLPLTS